MPIRSSAIVPLTIGEVSGWQSTGALVTNAVPEDGRVIVFAKEPVLEIHREPTPAVTVYGWPGTNYLLEFATNLCVAPLWIPWAMAALTDRFSTVPVDDPWLEAAYFRAREEMPPELPRLFVRKVSTNYVFTLQGTPGTHYVVEGMKKVNAPGLRDVAAGGALPAPPGPTQPPGWVRIMSVTLTAPVQHFTLTNFVTSLDVFRGAELRGPGLNRSLVFEGIEGPVYALKAQGQPGSRYEFQTATSLSAVTNWARLFEVTFTNASQVFHWTNQGEFMRFFTTRRTFYAPTNAAK